MKPYIRLIVYVISIALGLGVYFGASAAYDGTLFYIRVEEWFGFVAAIYVYLALLPTPLYAVFPQLPGRAIVTHARRAIGISSFCFALLHSSIAFFVLTDGFTGLRFLSNRYLLDMAMSSVALVILFLLAATSFDYMVTLLGPGWKRLHRFVYLAGLLVFIHIVALGAHFTDISGVIPTLLFIAVFVLLLLEGIRIDQKHVIGRHGRLPRFSWVFVVFLIMLTILYMLVSTGGFSLSAHGH